MVQRGLVIFDQRAQRQLSALGGAQRVGEHQIKALAVEGFAQDLIDDLQQIGDVDVIQLGGGILDEAAHRDLADRVDGRLRDDVLPHAGLGQNGVDGGQELADVDLFQFLGGVVDDAADGDVLEHRRDLVHGLGQEDLHHADDVVDVDPVQGLHGVEDQVVKTDAVLQPGVDQILRNGIIHPVDAVDVGEDGPDRDADQHPPVVKDVLEGNIVIVPPDGGGRPVRIGPVVIGARDKVQQRAVQNGAQLDQGEDVGVGVVQHLLEADVPDVREHGHDLPGHLDVVQLADEYVILNVTQRQGVEVGHLHHNGEHVVQRTLLLGFLDDVALVVVLQVAVLVQRRRALQKAQLRQRPAHPGLQIGQREVIQHGLNGRHV